MARRTYPQDPAVPVYSPGQPPSTNFTGQAYPGHSISAPTQNQPGHQSVPSYNYPGIPPTSSLSRQHQNVYGPPVSTLAVGVQQMSLGQPGAVPSTFSQAPTLAAPQPLPTQSQHDPARRSSGPPPAAGAVPGQPPKRTISAGQLSGQPPPPSAGVSGPVYPSQPPGQSSVAFPPPPTFSGQLTVGGQPTARQVYPPPAPPQGGPSGPTSAPPLTANQAGGSAMPPPPPANSASGQTYMPPGQRNLPPPPKVGETYVPPSAVQPAMVPPPPRAGEPFVHHASHKNLPPPPRTELAQSHPAGSQGQNLPPPPTAGQPFPAGQVASSVAGQTLSMGPTGQTFSSRAPAVQGPKAVGLGGAGMQGSAPDPELQPVNLMESRNILPSSPLSPPSIALPGNLGQFNPPPTVFCSTINAVPATSNMLNKLKLPLAISIHPYKEMNNQECPVIYPSLIVRCRVCRAYINPFVTFIDARHWRCNLCFRPNSLPEDFDFNPSTGSRGDRTHRVEIRRSSVEYIAPSEYMLRPPQPSVYYFLVDVSFNSVETGLLAVFCQTLLSCLDHLPGDARTMIGILTYDSTLHFYNLSPSLSQPQMLVVSDVEDVFLPSPNSLLVNLKEAKELVRTLLEDLPGMFAGNQSVKSALGAALQAGEKLLHPIGGRITVLQSCLPNIGPGALKYRDVTPSSVKKDTLNMAAASDFYKKLALECSSQQIAVDLFAFSGQFIDLSTISCVSKFSSGQVFYYPDFHVKNDISRQKVEKDLRRYLTRKIGFEAVMRVRCTEGLSMHTFHGNFFVRSTDLLSLPNVNPDHGYTMNIAIDESLKDIGAVCFQAALLYTSSRGERRIRVHTLCLPVATQLSHVYAKLNIQAITTVLANMAVDRSANATLGDAREALMNTAIDCTKAYRSNFASSKQASQFTLPASLRLLPVFMFSLLKHPAFTLKSQVSYDVRVQAMNLIKSLPLGCLMTNIYPRLYALHTLTEKDFQPTEGSKEEQSPPLLQLSSEKLSRYGVFLMDYGLGMYIWVSKDAPQEVVRKIFGVEHFGAIPEIMMSLPPQDNDLLPLVNKLIKNIRSSRQYFMPLLVIREDGPHRLLFIDKLVEDRTEDGTAYYEFLTHINRQLSK